MAFSFFRVVEASKLSMIHLKNQVHSIVANSAPQLHPKVSNSVPQVRFMSNPVHQAKGITEYPITHPLSPQDQVPVPQGIRGSNFGGIPWKRSIAFTAGISFAVGSLVGLNSGSGDEENRCLWCNDLLAENKCEPNKCDKLPYDTLREALEYLMQKKRFPCGHCQRFAISPTALTKHYADEHFEVFCQGKKCHCGAFFTDSVTRGIHVERTDRHRCTHRPGETNPKRKIRIAKERIKAHKVSFDLRSKYGY